ncbi:MAG: GntR family transcriptional regulator, partial [Thermotogota bacterium]|nr:GntR family transcriptional regulator [Thermotogota bacterium]
MINIYKLKLTNLQQEILRLLFIKTGMCLNQRRIATTLKVSQPAVMKSLPKLEKEELVMLTPRKGTYVKKLSLKEIKEIYDLRRLLEGFAAEKAAQFINKDQLKKMRQFCENHRNAAKEGDLLSCLIYNMQFHRVLVEASRNNRLLKV